LRSSSHRRPLGSSSCQLAEVLTTLRREENAPVNWPALTAEQAREQWPILAQWIAEVLVPWYEITRDELPDCRPLHPARPGPSGGRSPAGRRLALREHWNVNYTAAVDADLAWRSQREANQA
jgi:hypothetical protein